MHITDIDNRGTEAVPYGYVYFDDGHRVGYTGGEAWAVIGGGDWRRDRRPPGSGRSPPARARHHHARGDRALG